MSDPEAGPTRLASLWSGPVPEPDFADVVARSRARRASPAAWALAGTLAILAGVAWLERPVPPPPASAQELVSNPFRESEGNPFATPSAANPFSRETPEENPFKPSESPSAGDQSIE